jgi:phosphonate dehydrogenase
MVFMPDSIDGEFLEACPELRIVSAALKGYDNFDVEACTQRNVWFTIVPDLLTVPTAELAVGLLIALSRNVLEGDRLVRSGKFRGWRPVLYGMGLAGSKVGIMGLGAVGRAIAERLSGFGVDILYSDPRPIELKSEQVFKVMSMECVNLDVLLRRSDFVIVATPLTEDTFHLIDATRIGRMKRGSCLVNIGRGSTVDEEAVSQALDSGHLAGYAADVFEFEDWALSGRPGAVHEKLIKSSKTVLTPHIGSAVADVRLKIAMEAAQNIVQALSGEVPADAINHPEALVIETQRQ